MQEINDIPYKSKTDGVMHSCGHDAHAAMLLGAAMIVSELKDRIPGNIKLLFQPAEEMLGGGREMVKDGALKNPDIHAIFGLHQAINLDYGKVATSVGPVMAEGGTFDITIKGEGCHAAYPWRGVDIISAASELVTSLQLIHRKVSAFDDAVLTITSIKSSEDAYNIIADEVYLKGTLRTFKSEVRTLVMKEIDNVIKGLDIAKGTNTTISYREGYPATVNPPEMVDIINSAAEQLGFPMEAMDSEMGSEDFSYYQQQIPGGYFNLGVRDETHTVSSHNPAFDLDDRVLTKGAAMLAMCAVEFLG
jgi:amidohydrolase